MSARLVGVNTTAVSAAETTVRTTETTVRTTETTVSTTAIAAAAWLAQRCARPELIDPAQRLWMAMEAGHVGMAVAELGPHAASLSAASPYVVCADGWAYVARLHRAQTAVAAALRHRLHQAVDPRACAVDLTALFPASASEQRAAVERVLGRRVAVITGGPGTGKTWCLQRLLAARLALPGDCRIAVVAPTGKAAQRAATALRRGLDELPVTPAIRVAIAAAADDASTVHRRLGWNPQRGELRYGPGNPLPCDVLAIDEASMVDLVQFAALLAALDDTTQLIVMGDPGQLAAVETGVVLGDLAVALRGDPALSELTNSHRFHADGGIGRVAAALRRCLDGDALVENAAAINAEAVVAACTSGSAAVRLTSAIDSGLMPIIAHARALATAADGAAARAQLDDAQVICALRQGRGGVAGINALIEKSLGVSGERYAGRPVMITANDPASGLMNGDVGVVWPPTASDTAWRVHFPGGRQWPLGVLPAHVTAWAMTIHKSQGSEWPLTVCVLPEHDHPLLTAELLYTAITRARDHVTIVGSAQIVRAAALRRTARRSRLAEMIRAPNS